MIKSRDVEPCAIGGWRATASKHALAYLCTLALACTGSAGGSLTQQNDAHLAGMAPTNDLPSHVPDRAIEVYLTEFNLEIAVADLVAGRTYFHVRNASSLTHNFEIERPDVPGKLVSTRLKPGESKTVKVSLRSGRYLAYWPVPGLSERGYPVELHAKAAALSGK